MTMPPGKCTVAALIRHSLFAFGIVFLKVGAALAQIPGPVEAQFGVTAPGVSPRQFCAKSVDGQCWPFMTQDATTGLLTINGSALPAIGGDVACPAGNPTACVVNKIGGQTPAPIATTGSATDLSVGTLNLLRMYPLGSFQQYCNPTAVSAVPALCVKPVLEATDIAGVDPSGASDSTTGLRNAISLAATYGKALHLARGTYCLSTTTSTLALTAPGLEIYGDGEAATTIKYCAPSGSAIVPLMDITGAKAKIHDLGFDHNVTAGGYVEGTYLTGSLQPVGEAAVLNESDDSTLYNLSLSNGFDNCLMNIRITSGAVVPGSPQRLTERNIHTYSCGVGTHSAGNGGGPGKIGAGIDNASASDGSISDVIDSQSYGSFIADVGGGGFANWSNLTSFYSRVDPSIQAVKVYVPALYVGASGNQFHNVSVISPAAEGIWSDYGSGTVGNNYSNIFIKAAGRNSIVIKGPSTWSGVISQDPSQATPNTWSHIRVDATAPAYNFDMKGVSFIGTQAAYSVNVVGANAVVGRISAGAFVGTNGATNIPTTAKVDIETQSANGRGFGTPNPSYKYDFFGTLRVTASGAAAAYTTTAIGDTGDKTSARIDAFTGQRMAFGYDPVNAFWVQQGITPDVNTLNLMVNPSGGNVGLGKIAPGVADTTGYPMIGSVAGAPTGVPTGVPTGMNAFRYDTLHHELWVYDGGYLGLAPYDLQGRLPLLGHLYGTTAAPTITASAGTATPSTGINDTHGSVTISAAATITIKFAASFTNPPDCIVAASNGAAPTWTTTAGAVGTAALAITTSASERVTYHCYGR